MRRSRYVLVQLQLPHPSSAGARSFWQVLPRLMSDTEKAPDPAEETAAIPAVEPTDAPAPDSNPAEE